jgi:hypothetical protein
MLLADLVPYDRNPRDNDKAVPEVAASIKAFGFKGAIVCDREHEGGTPEHPVIVNGHTRVKALESLGYTEIPDEWIVYTDGLSEDEVKALRLADNRTAEAATWNRTLLQHEVKALPGIDMKRFGFDFKSAARPYGAERLKTDDRYNLRLVDAYDCGPGGYPELEAADASPKRLIGFNYAKSIDARAKRGNGCHFFIDDYQFERCWSQPERAIEYLRGFSCVLTPDFSLYMDMPDPMMRWNRYRSQALGHWWQDQGLEVVPTLTWAGPESYEYCFDGIPRGGTVAVSTVGVKKDRDATAVWLDGMCEAMDRLEPSRVLLYGGRIDFDFGSCEVIEYANTVTERMQDGRKRSIERDSRRK